MARHRRRHHRRHYSGAVEVNLGDYASFERSVTTKDVLLGLVAGIIGAGGASYAVSKLSASNPTMLPSWAPKVAPLAGGLAVGGAAWFLRKKKNRAGGFGNLVGAAGVGAVIAALPVLDGNVPFLKFSDAVSLNIPLQGLLVDDTPAGYRGLIVDDAAKESNMSLRGYADHAGMGRLAAASLNDGDDDYSAMAEASNLAAFASGEMAEMDVDGQG